LFVVWDVSLFCQQEAGVQTVVLKCVFYIFVIYSLK
jgi:hypothetical protein